MTISGAGSYFDGKTTARHDATVELGPTALKIRSADGTVAEDWPYGELQAVSSPDGVLRLGRIGSPLLARLEIRDPHLADAIDHLSIPVDRSGRAERRGRLKVVAWSVAATVSLLVVAIFGIPEIATRLAPLVPYGMERRVGAAVEAQVRRQFDTGRAGDRFECGKDERELPGRAAFEKLVGLLEPAAALPMALRVLVVRQSDANAFALPGGTIYVFKGLIDNSQNPHELAGVIGHEIGHVAHRDGTRMVLQYAGLSFLFGMLLGDFFGGGAVVIAAKVILQTSYSREVEASADAYAVTLMRQVGGDARALGTILTKIAGSTHAGLKILLDHPETESRVKAINAAAGDVPSKPLLDDEQWAALKRICVD